MILLKLKKDRNMSKKFLHALIITFATTTLFLSAEAVSPCQTAWRNCNTCCVKNYHDPVSNYHCQNSCQTTKENCTAGNEIVCGHYWEESLMKCWKNGNNCPNNVEQNRPPKKGLKK